MRKHLVVLLVAASVALLPSGRAEADDAGKIIAGLAALAIVGAVLANRAQARDDDLRGGGQVWDRVPPRHGGYLPPRHAGGRGQYLPGRCLLPGRGPALYEARCLQSAGIRIDRLPQACAVPLRGRGVGIDGRCLDKPYGWR